MEKNYGYKKHLFVCTNAPDKEGKCGHKGGEALRDYAKQKTRDLGMKKDVRVSGSGCLGYCEDGIVCVMYTKDPATNQYIANWKTNLKSTDTAVLAEMLEIPKDKV